MELTGSQSFNEIDISNLPVVPMIILLMLLIGAGIYLFLYDDYGVERD